MVDVVVSVTYSLEFPVLSMFISKNFVPESLVHTYDANANAREENFRARLN